MVRYLVGIARRHDRKPHFQWVHRLNLCCWQAMSISLVYDVEHVGVFVLLAKFHVAIRWIRENGSFLACRVCTARFACH